MPAPKLPKPANAKRWYEVRNAAGAVPTIELFGDIGQPIDGDPYWDEEGGAGTFKEFSDTLKALGPVPELRLEIHSCGGSVVVGKAIYDKLMEHPANKTAVVYGICASAATYPAMACEKIVMPANSFFLIHNSTGICLGNAEEVRRYADMLEVSDQSIAALYAARTGESIEAILAIMAADTWMTGTAAVEMGLADEIVEPITIQPAQRTSAQNFHRPALNSMPSEAQAWFDTRSMSHAKRILNRHSHPPIAMTEAELKAAKIKLEADQAAFEKTKNDAATEAARIKNEAQAEADKIIAAAKNPPVVEPKNLTAEDVKNLITEGNKTLVEEIKNLKETALKNLPGGPPLNHGKNDGGGEDAAPTNEAELKAALAKCKNHAEKRAITNAYDKRAKG